MPKQTARKTNTPETYAEVGASQVWDAENGGLQMWNSRH